MHLFAVNLYSGLRGVAINTVTHIHEAWFILAQRHECGGFQCWIKLVNCLQITLLTISLWHSEAGNNLLIEIFYLKNLFFFFLTFFAKEFLSSWYLFLLHKSQIIILYCCSNIQRSKVYSCNVRFKWLFLQVDTWTATEKHSQGDTMLDFLKFYFNVFKIKSILTNQCFFLFF